MKFKINLWTIGCIIGAVVVHSDPVFFILYVLLGIFMSIDVSSPAMIPEEAPISEEKIDHQKILNERRDEYMKTEH